MATGSDIAGMVISGGVTTTDVHALPLRSTVVPGPERSEEARNP